MSLGCNEHSEWEPQDHTTPTSRLHRVLEGREKPSTYPRRHRPPAKVNWLGQSADLDACFDRLHSTPPGSRHAAQEWMRSNLSWDR